MRNVFESIRIQSSALMLHSSVSVPKILENLLFKVFLTVIHRYFNF